MDKLSFLINDKDVLVYRSVYAPVKSNMFTLITGNEAVVIDPNEDEKLHVLLEDKGVNRIHILLTHGHYDHIHALEEVCKAFPNANVYIAEDEAIFNKNSPDDRQCIMWQYFGCISPYQEKPLDVLYVVGFSTER